MDWRKAYNIVFYHFNASLREMDKLSTAEIIELAKLIGETK